MPERFEVPGEQGVLSRPKKSGCIKGYRFFGGSKTLKRRHKAGRLCEKAHERKGWLETVTPITKEEKSSEGRSPRALGAEKGFQGSGSLKTAIRVAKPYVRHFWERRNSLRRLSKRIGEERVS